VDRRGIIVSYHRDRLKIEREVRRRAFLRRSMAYLAAGCAGFRHAPSMSYAPRVTESAQSRSAIGFSQAGDPIEVHHIGRGRRRVLILGGQHGRPEANTVELVQLFRSFFNDWPRELPSNLGLDVIPVANPDGLKAGIRQFLSGVDPNRNWDSGNWSPDAFVSGGGAYRSGLGGSKPFSERETRALADWILARRPSFVINYHSAGGFLLGERGGLAGPLAAAYATASDYWWPSPGVNPFSYSITGSMDDWLTKIGIPNIFIELTTYTDVELERNLAGLRAVLAQLAKSLPEPLIFPSPPR
jgi:Zinc carboxypeptidase